MEIPKTLIKFIKLHKISLKLKNFLLLKCYNSTLSKKALYEKQLNIGIIGLGVVGSSVAKILKENQDLIAARAGCQIVIKKGVVKNLSKSREIFDFPITNEAESI